MQAALRPYSTLVLYSASCQTAAGLIHLPAQEPCPLTFPFSLYCFRQNLTAVTNNLHGVHLTDILTDQALAVAGTARQT